MKNYFLLSLVLLLFISGTYAQQSAKAALQVEDIWNSSKLWARKAPGFNSMNDGKRYSNSAKGDSGTTDVVIYDYKTGKQTGILIKGIELKLQDGNILHFSDYHFNKTEDVVLLSSEVEQIDRYSTAANYYIYNLKDKSLKLLSDKGKQRYAEFSPDGKKIAFFRDNKLYVRTIENGIEKEITPDGLKNHIINGAGDWVYSEEFAVERAYRWSPDSKKIAYLRFDETAVKEFTYLRYDSLYPTPITFKYPKAGEKNSTVSVHVFDIEKNKTVNMDLGDGKDQYIPRIKWTRNSDQLSVQRLNRNQNKIELLLCNSNTGTSSILWLEQNNTFIEITDDLYFIEDAKSFIWSSTQDGYNHIYQIGMDGKIIRQITKGKWDVTRFYGYNPKTGMFYYQSTENGSTQRQIYKIDIKGNKTLLSYPTGVNEAQFSSSFDYFMLVYSETDIPFISSIRDSKAKEIRILNDNSAMRQQLATYQINKKEFFEFTTEDGVLLKGWMIKPTNFQSRERYPVVVHMYGGPGSQTVVSQTVMNQWENGDFLWHQLLSQKGYIVVSVDNRGTGGRGFEFNSCIHGRMGELELRDQLQLAKYLNELPYVDSERLCAQGWSFGGYLTALLLTKGNGVFKAGISVAPVTNWRYYDSVYIERYLGNPSENPDGYDKNSPITFAKDLQGNLLLMHGSADDNVHDQNTLVFTNALIKHNKQFEQFIYPNRNHNIAGGGARLHIYTKMTEFILKNL